MDEAGAAGVWRPGRRTAMLAAAGAAIAPKVSLAAAGDSAKAMAARYPAAALRATMPGPALKLLFGTSKLEPSAEVRIEAPDIAENGAVVPVVIDANEPHATAVALLAQHNPFAIACAYEIPPGTDTRIASRLKLAKTMNVTGVVKSGTTLRSASKRIKVTIGGCG